MSIVRAPRPQTNYTIVDKRTSENMGLSWAARGLAVFIQGKPDNWRVSVAHLRKQTAAARIKTGRDGIYALLKELKDIGYITTRQIRRRDGTHGEVEYIFHEEPLSGNPEAAPPIPAAPDTAEPTLTSTERATRPDLQTKTDSNNKNSRAVRANAEAFLPTCPEGIDAQLWSNYLAHRHDIGHPLRMAEDLEQVIRKLAEIRADGGDEGEAIELAINANRVLPLNKTNTPDRIINARAEAKRQKLLEDLEIELAERDGSNALGGRYSGTDAVEQLQ